MRTLFPLFLLAACTQPHVPDARPDNACEAGAFPRMEHVLNVEVDGKKRRALVWFPPTAGPHDVVVNLHEFRANPRTQVKYSGWVDHVADSNAILVAPDGKYAVWNAGECCGRAVDKHVDDVAYLDAVIEKLDEVACTSGDVVATGIGNGAMMAQMWSCESDAVDAVVSVGGALQWKECRNDRPVPLLHYHGTEDAFIPTDARGVGLAKQEGIKRDLDHAVGIWAARNGTTGTRQVNVGDLHCTEYTGGKAPMTSCLIQGGEDTWPGAPDGIVATESPLGDATMGAWRWVQNAWKARPEGGAPSATPAGADTNASDTDASGKATDTDTDAATAADATPATDSAATPDTDGSGEAAAAGATEDGEAGTPNAPSGAGATPAADTPSDPAGTGEAEAE